MYQVTKHHTGGILKGLDTTETTSVAWKVGQVVKRAIGGGSYKVVKVEMTDASSLASAIELSKREILADLESGVLCKECIKSFSDLHTYVDANEYGGATDENNPSSFEMVGVDFWSRVQDAVNMWIENGFKE